MVTTPQVKINPKFPHYPHSVYVAPITEVMEGGKRKVIGWRLTNPIPSDPSNLRYYQRKGFRLATDADIKRLAPLPEKAKQLKTVDNVVTVTCSICSGQELIDIEKIDAAIKHDLVVELVCGHSTRIDPSLLQWPEKTEDEIDMPHAKTVLIGVPKEADKQTQRSPEQILADQQRMTRVRAAKGKPPLKVVSPDA